MKHILVLLSLLCLLSCASRKRHSTSSRIVKDSTWTAVTYKPRDTLIKIPGDTSYFRVPIVKVTEEPIYYRSGHLTQSIRREGNEIVSTCKSDSLEIEIQIRDKEIEMHRHFQEQLKDVVIIPEKYVPGIYKTLAAIGGLVLLYGVGKIIKKVWPLT